MFSLVKKKQEFIWFDGKVVPENQIRVSVKAHSLHYGTAVFEGIRAYHHGNGLYVFRLKDHLRRMAESARMIHLDSPFSDNQLEEGVLDLLRKNNFRTSVYIRPITYVGEGELSLDFRSHSKHSAIYAFPYTSYFQGSGLRVMVSSWRRISQASLIPRAKASANYLNSCMATVEAKLAGYDEAVLLDEDGRIAEGSGENLFIVRKGVVITPPTYSPILLGITRDTVLKLAEDAGLAILERPVERSELYAADEVFFTGTACEVEPILEVDGRKVGPGGPGKVTTMLRTSYDRVVTGRSRKYKDWLTSVYPA